MGRGGEVTLAAIPPAVVAHTIAAVPALPVAADSTATALTTTTSRAVAPHGATPLRRQ